MVENYGSAGRLYLLVRAAENKKKTPLWRPISFYNLHTSSARSCYIQSSLDRDLKTLVPVIVDIHGHELCALCS